MKKVLATGVVTVLAVAICQATPLPSPPNEVQIIARQLIESVTKGEVTKRDAIRKLEALAKKHQKLAEQDSPPQYDPHVRPPDFILCVSALNALVNLHEQRSLPFFEKMAESRHMEISRAAILNYFRVAGVMDSIAFVGRVSKNPRISELQRRFAYADLSQMVYSNPLPPGDMMKTCAAFMLRQIQAEESDGVVVLMDDALLQQLPGYGTSVQRMAVAERFALSDKDGIRNFWKSVRKKIEGIPVQERKDFCAKGGLLDPRRKGKYHLVDIPKATGAERFRAAVEAAAIAQVEGGIRWIQSRDKDFKELALITQQLKERAAENDLTEREMIIEIEDVVRRYRCLNEETPPSRNYPSMLLPPYVTQCVFLSRVLVVFCDKGTLPLFEETATAADDLIRWHGGIYGYIEVAEALDSLAFADRIMPGTYFDGSRMCFYSRWKDAFYRSYPLGTEKEGIYPLLFEKMRTGVGGSVGLLDNFFIEHLSGYSNSVQRMEVAERFVRSGKEKVRNHWKTIKEEIEKTPASERTDFRTKRGDS